MNFYSRTPRTGSRSRWARTGRPTAEGPSGYSIKGFDKLDEDAAEEAFRVVGEKLQNGKQLLDRLLTDPEYASDPDVAPALKDVTDLMWYLRNKAEESAGAAFEKGALSIPDDGNLLRGYFDRCTEVYNRYSSHIKAQQEKAGGIARASTPTKATSSTTRTGCCRTA